MKSDCEAFNLGTGGGYSVLQLLKAFGKAANREIPYKVGARRPGDVAKCYAEVSKAARDLKWRTTLSLETGAADHIRWQTQNPNGFN